MSSESGGRAPKGPSILVPLDASPFGEHALPTALGIARRCQATLHLAHVHAPVPPPAELEGTPYYDAAYYGAVVEREKEYMSGIRDRLERLGNVRLETALLAGSLPDALHEHGRKIGATLIVMSTHGYEGVKRLLQHGLVDRLLRRSGGPVLAIRPPDDAPPPDDLGGDVTFEHILIPLDGSPAGERILRSARAIGALFGARYTLVRVLSTAAHATPAVVGQEVPAEPRLLEEHRAQAERYLESISSELRREAVECDYRVISTDAPAEALLTLIRDELRTIDLIAMETRARKGLSRLLHGSVAGSVLQEAPVPVLLHHRPDPS